MPPKAVMYAQTPKPTPKVSVTGRPRSAIERGSDTRRMTPDMGVFPLESHKYNGACMVYEPLRPCLLLEHEVYG